MQSFLLLNTDLQTAHHLLHHEGHGLTHIPATSVIISSCHCSLLGVTHCTAKVLTLTHAPLQRGSEGAAAAEAATIKHAHTDKTHPVIKQKAAISSLLL